MRYAEVTPAQVTLTQASPLRFSTYPQISLAGERMFTYTECIQEALTFTAMSKHQTIKTIRMELAKINQEIDLRIIKGVAYAREARRHKYLTSQLARLSPRRSLFGKLSFMSAFMF